MRAGIFAFIAFVVSTAKAADSIVVQLHDRESATVLEWHSQLNLPLAGMAAEYKIEWSSDLKNWQILGEPVRGGIGVDDEIVRHGLLRPAANAFYRLSAKPVVAGREKHPDSIYGYATLFSRKLQGGEQLSLKDFVDMYAPTNQYRAQISFDPTTALFWNEFNTDPTVYNSTNTTNDQRLTDFRFTAEEFAIFKTNGFVVSPRLGSHSFADAFYKVYIDDLPVYVSSDALLHAWHRTYVSVLAEVEASFLVARFGLLLTNMISQIPALHAEAAGTPLEQGLLDADFHLAVANSLLTGTNDPGQLNQFARINKALDAVASLRPQWFDFFGVQLFTDFSQYTVRGHYAETQFLQNYFRAMMWCGQVDFRFVDHPDPQSLREFSGAVALTILLNRSNSLDKWTEFDQTIRTWVGLPDCMNFAQLSDLLAAAKFGVPFDQLANVYDQFWRGDLGVQQIRSGYQWSPVSPEQMKLPRSFATMPQRFIVDSWALSKVVFDSIIWDDDGVPDIGDKVQRRIPSGLDVAFAVFGNDDAVPEIASRIADKNGRRWRDGEPYQHNLAAARQCIDDHNAGYWTNNIYTAWLGCLRALSSPTIGPSFPESMQTRAWAMSSLNSQLASWTELRHDTILYAKQSSTGMILCGYPDAYVEPRPEFWRRFGAMAARTRDLLQALPNEGRKTVQGPGIIWNYGTAELKANWHTYYSRFVAAANMLESISQKQLDRVALNAAEIEFLQDIVEQQSAYMTRGNRTYTGWYPRLFYKPLERGLEWGLYEGADIWNPVVTDVHTDAPDPYGSGDPGCILHEAVGNINMAFMVVECGENGPVMYAGPVMSHYEFEQDHKTRLTDAQWKQMLKSNTQPAPPSWTKPFLAPGNYTVSAEIN